MPFKINFINYSTAAAAKSLQSCLTLCNPIDGSPQAPPSLGFSRQEHWSGLPFRSPMHESEKWRWSHWVASNSQRPHGLQPTRLLCPWDFPGKSTGVGYHCLLRLLVSPGNFTLRTEASLNYLHSIYVFDLSLSSLFINYLCFLKFWLFFSH